jgi:hypothetical protein
MDTSKHLRILGGLVAMAAETAQPAILMSLIVSATPGCGSSDCECRFATFPFPLNKCATMQMQVRELAMVPGIFGYLGPNVLSINPDLFCEIADKILYKIPTADYDNFVNSAVKHLESNDDKENRKKVAERYRME